MNFKVVSDIYAIRHIPSGNYMPETRSGKGYTSIETEDFLPFGKLPRLFGTRGAALKALNCWLKGRWEAEYKTDDWTHGISVVGASPPKQKPNNRPASNMEIVEFEIREL